jgi:hypothetical protein
MRRPLKVSKAEITGGRIEDFLESVVSSNRSSRVRGTEEKAKDFNKFEFSGTTGGQLR